MTTESTKTSKPASTSRYSRKATHPYGVWIESETGTVLDSCHTTLASAKARRVELDSAAPKSRDTIIVAERD